MRKRIKELASGRVECIGPAVEFSVGRVEIEVAGGDDAKGEVALVSKTHVPVRGIVYSSHPRMVCPQPYLSGGERKLSYCFHSVGLLEGDVEEGFFCIACSQGEYTLPFSVVVTARCERLAEGPLRGLSDFADLAKEDWEKAKRAFRSPGFMQLMQPEETKERFFYRGILGGVSQDVSLEEFLLACGLKEPVLAKAAQEKLTVSGVSQKIRQEACVRKSAWGYVEFEVSSDAAFIEPEKRLLTSADFLGSEAQLGFYLNPEKMHSGKNFGRLLLRNARQEITVSVQASPEGARARDADRKQVKECLVKLLNAYVDYRLKRLTTGKWAFSTYEILDRLTALEPKNAWHRLFKAQAFWTNGQRQEAEWILNEFKRGWKDKKSPEWGYYLYICTLMEYDEKNLVRLADEIERIYLEHKESPALFFSLLFLRADYEKNPYLKLKALEERIMEGAYSPVLYAEALGLYEKEPYLLRKLGAFELVVLNWARRRGLLTRPLAKQLFSDSPEKLPYKKSVLSLLEEGYALMGEDEGALHAICAYLIRNQKHGASFFRWYALGVEKKLRITGLYEAYLLSMDETRLQEVPKIIRMYFKYNHQLGYRQKAMLYVNIIAGKEKWPNVYEAHRPEMEKFAYEQMERGRIDDNLAVIYQEALSCGIYSPQISDALSGVLFMHRLSCFLPGMARVIVIQKQLRQPIVAPLVGRKAYFPLYSNEYAILLEDRQGNRYGSGSIYQLEKLMHPGKYIKACMEYSPKKLPYLLYYFADREAWELFEEKDLAYFWTVMESDEVEPSYQATLFPKLVRILKGMDAPEEMRRAFRLADFSLLDGQERNEALAACMEQRLYEQAYGIVETYGAGRLSPAKLVPFLAYFIEKLEEKEDPILLWLCQKTYFDGKYNDTMLSYLCRYYQGPTERMACVYKSAAGFYVDTHGLPERLLTQMLYTARSVDCAEDAYRAYAPFGDSVLKRAYLNFFADRAITGEGTFPEGLHKDLREWREDGRDMTVTLCLALLSHIVKQPSLMEKEGDLAEGLLKELLFQGVAFPFYKELPQELLIRYQLYDKQYVEYRTKKRGRAWFSWRAEDADGAYAAVEMTESYTGIFVKELTLFCGEAIRYRILEEADGQKEIVEKGTLYGPPLQEGLGGSRYGRLCGLSDQKEMGDMEGLMRGMRQMERLDQVTSEMFTVLK